MRAGTKVRNRGAKPWATTFRADDKASSPLPAAAASRAMDVYATSVILMPGEQTSKHSPSQAGLSRPCGGEAAMFTFGPSKHVKVSKLPKAASTKLHPACRQWSASMQSWRHIQPAAGRACKPHAVVLQPCHRPNSPCCSMARRIAPPRAYRAAMSGSADAAPPFLRASLSSAACIRAHARCVTGMADQQEGTPTLYTSYHVQPLPFVYQLSCATPAIRCRSISHGACRSLSRRQIEGDGEGEGQG